MTTNGTPKIDSRRYACETRVVAGLGTISTIPTELSMNHISHPIVVSDAGIANAGLLDKWLAPEVAKIPRVLSKVNPDLTDVEEGLKVAKDHGCDGIVIIGGGSALCLGKAISIALTNPGHISDYEGFGKVKTPPVPVIAVPTTAGSGSEVSRALVLHEQGRPNEIVIVGYGTEPRVAILDGNVLKDLPARPALDAALDAMTHACESLWVRNKSFLTDCFAEKALTTFLEILPRTLKERRPEDLQKILEASSAANLACGNTGLGLVHALTSAPDVHLAHGYQNGALLLAVARFNRPEMAPEHQKLVDQLEGVFKQLGYSGRFTTTDIGEKEAKAMVKASTGHPFRANNIRSTTDEDLFAILRDSGATVSASA